LITPTTPPTPRRQRITPFSVTEDLLDRFADAVLWPAGTPPEAMLVTYVRATHLDDRDPREFVLRPTVSWTLLPDVTFGFGRAPAAVDIEVPLMEEHGRADTRVPRLAGKLTFENGLWRLTNHATKDAIITVSGPGLHLQITNASPTYAIRSRLLILTVSARRGGGAGAELVEHRFTLLTPRIPDDLPTVLPGAVHAVGGQTSDTLSHPKWTRDQQRLLAAWAYPELLGLAPRGLRRGQLTRRLLRQSATGEDPNERTLATLRRNAGKATGLSMTGETGTPLLLDHLVARRGFLGAALADLHTEYDQLHPAG
jgi:hypothetical protein